MGAMMNFLMWCEEKGYCEWSDLTYDWAWSTEKTQGTLMKEWTEEIRNDNA